MKFEEPVNRKVMRQYLLGPVCLGALLLCVASIGVVFPSAGREGVPYWVRATLLILFSVGFVGVVVTALRSLFSELLEARDYFESVFGSMVTMVVVTDSHGRIRTANRAAIERLGYSEISLRDVAFPNLIADSASDPFLEFNPEKHSGKKFLRDFETSLVTGEGKAVPVVLSASVLKDSSGRSVGMVFLAQDVTEKKRAEEEARKMQAQLVQASKLASLGTIGSGVAHELNNPLTIVKASADIILDNLRDPELVRESVVQIQHSANRMKKLTDHLRTFARESKKDDWEQLDISVPIRNSLVLLEQKFRTEDISLSLELQNDLPVIWGDSNQLESVFQNLLTNSRDAFDEITDSRRKTIEIRTSQTPDGGVLVTYRDNATGMSAEVMERIFDPFFTTKGAGKGTGLGMSILHGIIQKHRGKLELDSEPGRGTTIRIALPADRRAAKRGGGARSAEAPTPRSAPTGPLPSLLIVDDEIKIAQLLKLMLKNHFAAEVAEDAADGMRWVERRRFDLIITDLQMPQFSGIEIVDAVMKHQPETPVVLMSGNGDGDAKVQKALARGAVAILDKPFKDPGSVQQFLEECLNRGRKSVA